MKRFISRNACIITLMILVSWQTAAQDDRSVMASGIYLTAKDLHDNKLSWQAVTDPKNCLHEQLDKVILVRDGKKSKLNYGVFSGFYKDGFRYRAHGSKKKFFSSYGYYKILDESGLIIYSKRSATHKTAGRTWYYYSLSIDSPIKRLTPGNLREDFADYPVFLDFAMTARKNGTLVTNINNRLLINELYLKKVKGE
jgi:hypothetical protein